MSKNGAIMPVEKVHNVIRQLRREHNITQEDLGKSVGVSRQTIISIERGKYIPSLPLALKISRYFQRSTDDIFTLDH